MNELSVSCEETTWLVNEYEIGVPLEYDVEDWDHDSIYDFDTEQSEVRYDPKLLSEELEDTIARQRGASCNLSNIIYEHGEQVARNDPCEVCVCMDGEIFCYWRQCSDEVSEGINYSSNEQDDDSNSFHTSPWKLTRSSQPSKHIKSSKYSPPTKVSKLRKVLRPTKISWSTKPPPPPTIPPKPTKLSRMKKVHKTKRPTKHPRKPARKRMKSKKVFSFPEHLPATLHFDIDSANRREESSEDSGEIKNESSDLLHGKLTMRPDSLEDAGNGNHMVLSTTAASKENVYPSRRQQLQGANSERSPQFQSAERNISQNDPNVNGWQGFSLNLSNSTITPSSLSSTTQTTTTEPTTTAVLNSSNNNDGSSNMQNKHINFQSGGIIPNDESIDSENDSDDNDDDSGISGDNNSNDKKAEVEKAGPDNDSGPETTRIQFVDVPLAKHYIITSSGSVENADILASENVLSQFRNDYSIVSSDSTANNPSPPLPAATPSASLSFQLPARTNGNATDAAIQEEESTAIISNDAVKSPSSLSATMPALSAAEVRVPSSGSGSVTAEVSKSNATPSPTSVDVGGIVPPDSLVFSVSQPAISSTSGLSSLEQEKQNGEASSVQLEKASTEQPTRLQQECVVMGATYQVGAVLPQETGNCLQCVCVEGSSAGDSPRVTCSPHNCPPLVLPDLFDTTGY
ncbi:unnamed protein product [Hermetia illucens]|uniref:Uncharacterized protein n=1 Tax=Hermetia illucens TaxID=343691 RepID=A0A7R8UAU9_HERIL|nr:unnamed protein product [Hermetia illucens]